ncbi:uncharacterized protein LOC144904726 [Branchiostoma floridae x Branchiostoma belcheri]
MAEDIGEKMRSEEAGEKLPITVFLEDKADSRHGPIILNGVKTKWSQAGFCAAALRLRALNPGVTQKAITDVLALFKSVLDDYNIPNALPGTYRQALSAVKDFLPHSETYHACPNDCVLYDGDLADAQVCPNSKCKEKRFDERGKPKKEYVYFPLIDTLKRMYGIPEVAKMLQDHVEKLKDPPPAYVSDIQETPKWKELYGPGGFFKGEPRSISLAYSTDGGEPFSHLRIPHSVWPQVLKIYNLAAEFRDKVGLLIMLGMIPGPTAPQHMNTYHQRLVAEMKQLMDGIQVWDSHKEEFFTLTADILAYIFDWPGRSKCTCHQGARAKAACPYCQHESEFSHLLKGTSYEGSRRFLPLNHPLRSDDKGFPGKRVEMRGPPPPHTDQEEYGQAIDDINKEIQQRKDDGNTEGIRVLQSAANVMLSSTGKTGLEILAEIPTYHTDRVVVDWMHTGKNIIHNTFDVVTGSKSNFDSLVQIEAKLGRFNCSVNNTAGSRGRGGKRTREVTQVFQLSSQQKTEADQRLLSIRVPLGYDFKVRGLFHKQLGMKTIEWLKFFAADLAKYAMRGMLPTDQRETLFRLCETLQRIGAPVQNMEKLPELELNIHVTFSLLEKYFPLAMKTLMFHLPHHMTEIIQEFGPVTGYWMMPFERYMSFLLKRMTNRSRPEKSAVEAYKVSALCHDLGLAGEMPETTDPVESLHEATIGEGEGEEEREEEEEEDAGLVTVTPFATALKHLKGPPDEMKLNTESDMYMDLLSQVPEVEGCRMNPKGEIVVSKYLAATKRHAVTHRLHEYRCEVLEERRNAKSISSLISTCLAGDVYFGRIQFFVLVAGYELAYVKWYGVGRRDEETRLWKVTLDADGDTSCSIMNPFQALSGISKPFPHATEGDSVFILDCNEYDLMM